MKFAWGEGSWQQCLEHRGFVRSRPSDAALVAKRCWVSGAGRLAVVPRAPRQVAFRTQHRSNWSRSTVLAPFGHTIRAFPACPPCAGDSTRREAGPYSAQFRRSLSQDINVIYVAVGLVRLGQLPRCTVSPSDHTYQRRFSGSALAVVLSVLRMAGTWNFAFYFVTCEFL